MNLLAFHHSSVDANTVTQTMWGWGLHHCEDMKNNQLSCTLFFDRYVFSQ